MSNPEAGLVLDYNISQDDLTGNAYPGNFPGRTVDTVLAFETTLPSSFSGSSGFLSIGGTGIGAWAGVYNDSGTYKFALSSGDGNTSASPLSSTTIRAVDLEPISNIPEFDGGTHTVVLEFKINPGRVRAWIDGTLYLEGSTTDGSALESNSWCGTYWELFGSTTSIAGFPTSTWSGALKSGLRVYSDTLVGGKAIYGIATYGVASYGEVPEVVNLTTIDDGLTGSTTTATATGDSNTTLPSVQATATPDADLIIEADALHTVTSIVGTSATGSVGVVGVSIYQTTGVEATGQTNTLSVSGDSSTATSTGKITSSVNTLSVSGDSSTNTSTGSITGSVSTVTVNAGATGIVSGVSATMTASDDVEAFSRVIAEVESGVQGTTTLEDVIVSADCNTTIINVVDLVGTTSVNTASVVADANVVTDDFEIATFIEDIAAVYADANVDISGVQATNTADGDVVIEGDALHVITFVQGVVSNGGVGDVLAGATVDSVTGVEATGQVETFASVTGGTGVFAIPEAVEATGSVETVDVSTGATFELPSTSATFTVNVPADFISADSYYRITDTLLLTATIDTDIDIEADASHVVISVQGQAITGGIGEVTAGAVILEEESPSVEATGTVYFDPDTIIGNAYFTLEEVEAIASADNVIVLASALAETSGNEATTTLAEVTATGSAVGTATTVTITSAVTRPTVSTVNVVFNAGDYNTNRVAYVITETTSASRTVIVPSPEDRTIYIPADKPRILAIAA